MLMNTLRRLRTLRDDLLGRPTPKYRDFGFGRGWPIDRYYIEAFLQKHSADVHGEVLEAAAEPNYTRQFGGDRVTRSHILYPVPGKPGGTIVGDLGTGEGIPSAVYDCLIMTQVFQFIYDMKGAVAHSYRSLKDDGVILATFAGISQIAPHDMNAWGEFWRVTDSGARHMFADVFGAENVSVEVFGNVLTACSFLHGLVIGDLEKADLDYQDPEYQLIIAVRAVKRAQQGNGTA